MMSWRSSRSNCGYALRPIAGHYLRPDRTNIVAFVGGPPARENNHIAKGRTAWKGEGKRCWWPPATPTGPPPRADRLRQDREIVKTPRERPASASPRLREKARGFDVAIVDTAGRLHTQAHLMRELEKIHKVVTRQVPGAPHETLMVLDATTGQNAVTQAEMFSKSVKCTGIVLTKLDGTAKGGAIFAIKHKVGLPVKYVGVGEGLDDLEVFDPDAYTEALFA